MLKDAFALHTKGKFAEAERAYADVLRREPGNFQALHLCGVLALQRGQTQRAVELLRESLKLEPRQPLAYRDLGNGLQQIERFAEALDSYDKALALKPDLADIHNNRAIALASLGRREEALESYGRAVALKPDYAQAYNNRGTVLLDLGRAGEALADFNQAIALDPNYARAFNNRGNVLTELGRYEEALNDHDRAIALQPQAAESHDKRGNVLVALRRAEAALESFDRAIAIDPSFSSPHNGRGTALAMLGRPQEALEAHDRALARDPNSAAAHNNRGTALATLKRPADALVAHDRALALDPLSANAHNNRGTALALLGRLEEGLESLDRALSLHPDLTQAHVNRGNFLTDLKRYDEALASFDRAVTLNPGSADAHFGRSLVLLLRGRFEDAWAAYEWRKRRVAPGSFHEQGRPEWTGKEDIAGKTLFIEAEQGLGDTIHFCRYAPLAADRGARVIMTVQASLVHLLRTLDPRIEILPAGSEPALFDYHAALLSLPLAFGTKLATIPAAVPYLRAEPERVRRLRERIGDAGFKIGLCWQGSYIAGTRSFPLGALEDISRLPGVRLISLQKGDGVEQLNALPDGMRVENLGSDFPEDFADTAAAMEAMDLIISCDTSVAHLAGALGRPTWVALRHASDWRWLLDRKDSPWYPSLHLFRQPAREDWTGLFKEIEARLAAILAAKTLFT
ncbi:MAG: tetratricopeptide repeat protein [Pseudomonadota bacterium]